MGNRFASFISLCGLTQQEAADYLGIAKRTVAMKATDLRTPTADEIRRLVDLWQRISTLDVELSDDVPEGARQRQVALREARRLTEQPNPEEGGMSRALDDDRMAFVEYDTAEQAMKAARIRSKNLAARPQSAAA